VEKIDAAFEYATSPLFSDAERAALSLANDSSLVPNAASDAHFAELAKHFNDQEIVEIVSVISLFGWLNRWNDTMATSLEDEPRQFAGQQLASRGWQQGSH
jgi:alkylhydroperoxidase family enzyme